MSVRTAMPRSRTLFKIRRPSLMPGPRYEFTLEQLALSKDALNTKGTFNFDSAVASMLTCSSLSITQGPATSAKGPPPISTVGVMRTIAGSRTLVEVRHEHACPVVFPPAHADSRAQRRQTHETTDAAPRAST